jgi:hypothetical protein
VPTQLAVCSWTRAVPTESAATSTTVAEGDGTGDEAAGVAEAGAGDAGDGGDAVAGTPGAADISARMTDPSGPITTWG